jgi:hypothetical protein
VLVRPHVPDLQLPVQSGGGHIPARPMRSLHGKPRE